MTTIVKGRERGWDVVVEKDTEPIPADAVIVASEGWAAASMLESVAPGVAEALREINYPPVSVVALGYGAEARGTIPEGFGVLIPRDAGYRSLGVTSDGYLFPREDKSRLLVRVLLGGRFDPEIATLDNDEVIGLAESEVQRLYGLTTSPVYRRARAWSRAIPQYEIGHGARVSRIESELSRTKGIFLAGNALYGPAFGKAAARGVNCGHEAIERLVTG